MGTFFLRTLFILIAIAIILVCIPQTRRMLINAARQRQLHELKKPFAMALLIYFLLSVFLTIRDCSNQSVENAKMHPLRDAAKQFVGDRTGISGDCFYWQAVSPERHLRTHCGVQVPA